MRGIEIFGSMQNVAPVFDYIDIDGLVDHVKDVLGLPAKIMRSKAEVQVIQQQKQQQQMEQQQLQQAQQVAESAGKIAPALKAVQGG
jgi:formate-dependent phosphoribosylglycinamide formyltransferase (GAR transformylase)